MSFKYDVALSFAGEDRYYVEQVANILHELGLKVFYDNHEDEAVDLWGKDLYVHLDNIYQQNSKYCVMFVSKYYKQKLWTNHERKSAQARAFLESEEYILPLLFDDTEIPGILPTTGYLRINDMTPEQVSHLIIRKVAPHINIITESMLSLLRDYLPEYDIKIDGTSVIFVCEKENYRGAFPLRLLLEMHKLDELLRMFIMPSIVPW